MKRIFIFLVVASLVTGCGVSKMKVQNWNPNDSPRGSSFYECLQQAQQGEFNAAFGANQYGAGGGAHAGAKTNTGAFDGLHERKRVSMSENDRWRSCLYSYNASLSVPFALLGVPVYDFY